MQQLDRFYSFYGEFTSGKLSEIGDLYSNDIVFIDPVRRIEGLPELTQYFEDLCGGFQECRFDFTKTDVKERDAYVSWVMHLTSDRLNQGRPVDVEGISHLQLDESRIFYHRDYFDLGAMIYERVPVLSWCINGIKNRL